MLKIRPMEKKGVKACVAIVRQNYTPTYAKCANRELRHMFKENIVGLTFVVAERDGEIIGFAGFSQGWVDYHLSEIFWVNVSPEEKGAGIGKKLVNKILCLIRKSRPRADFILLTAKPEVCSYYRQFGFRTLRRFGPNNYALMGLLL